MTHHNETHSKDTETPRRVFVSRARVHSEEQHGALSEQEKEFEKSCQDRGVWLELFCPDDACLTVEERFSIPVFCEDPKVKKNVVLELFCPRDSCEVVESTRLP
ncbi:MAG: hypothetical protein WBG37_00360 [Desulfobacterales bacterium]